MLRRFIALASEVVVQVNEDGRNDREGEAETQNDDVSDGSRQRRRTSEERLISGILLVQRWNRLDVGHGCSL